jgi:hypothetical protein
VADRAAAWALALAHPDGCPVAGVARPPHYDEGRDRECPGVTRFAVGDLDAACDTCGGRTGWAVAGLIEPVTS